MDKTTKASFQAPRSLLSLGQQARSYSAPLSGTRTPEEFMDGVTQVKLGISCAPARLRSGGSLSQKEVGAGMETDMPNYNSSLLPETHTLVIPNNVSRPQRDNRPWWQKFTRDILFDLVILFILAAICGSLEKAEPRQVWLVKDTLWRHAYPFKPNTVPSWAVPVYSFGTPLAVFVLHKLFVRSSNRAMSWYDWYRVSLAMVNAVLLTGAITNCIKIAIGRPRPNFVFRCWADGNPVWQEGYTQYGGFANCTTPDHQDFQHRKSFPSGHTSWSAAGLGFLTLWLFGQTQAFSGYPHVWRISFSLIPAFAALVVGITRITDYWHHVSDVCFGLALGYSVALVFYNQLFPWFTHEDCNIPLTHGSYSTRTLVQPARTASGRIRTTEDGQGHTRSDA